MTSYNYYGIRTCRADENYKIGDICRNSYDWDFENDCSSNNELDGTCCTQIDTNVDHRYGEGRRIIIAGDSRSYGSDAGEIIIKNAVVIKILL
jgi:hypothetical protein